MTASELITPQHLQKKAVIYVRQSTLTQVILNQESLRLQYALEQRAKTLGWRSEDIEVIDADLGLTGASAQYRTGCAGTGDESHAGTGGHASFLRKPHTFPAHVRFVFRTPMLRLPS